MLRHALLAAGLLLSAAARAAEPESAPPQEKLPEPLSLEYALQWADRPHPTLDAQLAAEQAAVAGLQLARSRSDLQVNLIGRLRFVDPSPLAADTNEDNALSLQVNKTLYDFGRSSAKIAAAEKALQAQASLLADTRAQRRLKIVEAYLEVLLADLQNALDNEIMAVNYVELDRKRKRHELQQISQVELARAEDAYQRTLQAFRRSQSQQRARRALLANQLNTPDQLPATLTEPKFPNNARALPDLKQLQQRALLENPQLQALRSQIEAAEQKAAAARANKHPTLTGVAQATEWQRDLSGRDRAYVGVEIDFPLYAGGKVDSEIAQSLAEASQLRAKQAEMELQVRQSLLELWLKLQDLQSQREQIKAMERFSDIRLDRNRVLYEMEYNADLGDSLVGQSEVRLRSAETEFGLALAWETLAALVGGQLD